MYEFNSSLELVLAHCIEVMVTWSIMLKSTNDYYHTSNMELFHVLFFIVVYLTPFTEFRLKFHYAVAKFNINNPNWIFLKFSFSFQHKQNFFYCKKIFFRYNVKCESICTRLSYPYTTYTLTIYYMFLVFWIQDQCTLAYCIGSSSSKHWLFIIEEH